MPILIDQMQVQVSDQPTEPPSPSAATATQRLDPEAIQRLIRRAQQRRERLVAD